MSAFVLKLIAIFTMFIDHIGYIFSDGKLSYFNYIGRISFPIFAFQISEGYVHTKNLKKYFLRLFLFALISQIPFMLFDKIITDKFYLNIFFTLFLGLTAIFVYDKSKYKILGIIAGIAIGLIAKFTHCDYGFFGIAIILIFYIFKNNFINASIFFIIATAIRYAIPLIKYGNVNNRIALLFSFTCIPLIFIAGYNGKKGKDTKYLLYLFYPIHLILIYGLYLILKL